MDTSRIDGVKAPQLLDGRDLYSGRNREREILEGAKNGWSLRILGRGVDVRRRLPERLGELRHELAAGGARDRVGRAQLRLDERRRRAGPRRDGPTDDRRGLDGYLCGNQPVRRVRRDDSARTRREILTTQTVTVGYAGAVAT